MANFLAGNYNGFSQTFGDPVISQLNPNVGLYVQDEWRAGSKLTLNLGLRYDLQFIDTVNTDTNNLSPRAGFAWSPTSSPDLLIRGSAGLFFDRVPLRAVANALLSAGNTTDLSQLHQPQVSGILPTQAGAPTFPNILPERLPSTTLISVTTMDKNLQNAYSKQAGLEVERAFGALGVLSVGYQYFKGESLLMSVNQNVPTCAAAGTNNGCRPVLSYMNNGQYPAAGDSNYHGLHVSYVQRPRDWSSLRLTYTLSKSMNNLGEAFFSSPTDPDKHQQRLGTVGQRPAAPPGGQRLGQLAELAGDNRLGAAEPRLPGEHDDAVLLVPALQHRVWGEQPAGHRWTAVRGRYACRRRTSMFAPSASSRAMPGPAATSSR